MSGIVALFTYFPMSCLYSYSCYMWTNSINVLRPNTQPHGHRGSPLNCKPECKSGWESRELWYSRHDVTVVRIWLEYGGHVVLSHLVYTENDLPPYFFKAVDHFSLLPKWPNIKCSLAAWARVMEYDARLQQWKSLHKWQVTCTSEYGPVWFHKIRHSRYQYISHLMAASQ